MDNQIIQEAVDKILSVLPNQAGQLARLVRLMQFACDPTITVIGKYNHGKSRLLNELIGTDIFLLPINERRFNWPNINKIRCVGWMHPDSMQMLRQWMIVMLLKQSGHRQIFAFCAFSPRRRTRCNRASSLQQLIEDADHSRRQTILVLTQIDQIPDQTILTQIKTSIAQQVPKLDIWAVSATRHRQGIENGKTLLIEKVESVHCDIHLSRHLLRFHRHERMKRIDCYLVCIINSISYYSIKTRTSATTTDTAAAIT